MLNIHPQQRPSVSDLIKLPQVSLRLKEKQLKETHSAIKLNEDSLKARETLLSKRLS